MNMLDVAAVLLLLYIVVVFLVFPAMLAYYKGVQRERAMTGLALGLFLGWLGVLIIAVIPRRLGRTPQTNGA
jgi:chromate transport protein ChrA